MRPEMSLRPEPEGEDLARLLGVVRRFRGRRVAVLGDLVADEFVYGDIARVSREAPVLILEHRRTVVAPGAAGNAAANLAALGARPYPVGIVGADEAGRLLRADLARRGVVRSGILVHRDYQTPSKSRLLAGGLHTRRQQIVRVDRGATDLPAGAAGELRRRLARAMSRVAGLLVADYGYGAATPALVAAIAPRFRSRSLPVLIDSRRRVADYRDATACTPNQEELERALGIDPLQEDGDVEDAGRRLLRRTRHGAVLVTRGARGMTLFERGDAPCHIPAFGSDEVADVTGAGDTVIAVFTLALIAGADFRDAARLSNYAAGLVVMKAGTATADAGELERAVREDLGARSTR